MFEHCLYFNTAALARRLERVWAEAFAPFDLSPPQGFMLRAIVDRPGLLQRDLSEGLCIARPTATRALDGLEAKWYIERRRSDADGREVAIFALPAAIAVKQGLDQASAGVTARLKQAFGNGAFTDAVATIREFHSALA